VDDRRVATSNRARSLIKKKTGHPTSSPIKKKTKHPTSPAQANLRHRKSWHVKPTNSTSSMVKQDYDNNGPQSFAYSNADLDKDKGVLQSGDPATLAKWNRSLTMDLLTLSDWISEVSQEEYLAYETFLRMREAPAMQRLKKEKPWLFEPKKSKHPKTIPSMVDYDYELGINYFANSSSEEED